jgi:hypothetical protein
MPPPRWTQGVEACYSWNNTIDRNSFNTEELSIWRGVHYFKTRRSLAMRLRLPSPACCCVEPYADASTDVDASATPIPSTTATPRPHPSHAPDMG